MFPVVLTSKSAARFSLLSILWFVASFAFGSAFLFRFLYVSMHLPLALWAHNSLKLNQPARGQLKIIAIAYA